MPGPRSWGNLAKKRVIPFKRGKKEGNKRRLTQTPDEKTYVEIPFIEQLKGMGWDHIVIKVSGLDIGHTPFNKGQ